MSDDAFDSLAHLNPVKAFVQLCAIARSREMGVWRATTLRLERWSESVHMEDAAHPEEFGTKGCGDGVVTERELRDAVALLVSTPPPSPYGET